MSDRIEDEEVFVKKKRAFKNGLTICMILVAVLAFSNVLFFIEVEHLRGRIDDIKQAMENLQKQTGNIEQTWHMVRTFEGKVDETTAPFSVEGDLWRITWVAEAEIPEYAFISIWVYPEGETSKTVYTAITYPDEFIQQSTQCSVGYIAGKGNYYLKVMTANLNSWVIQVESYH